MVQFKNQEHKDLINDFRDNVTILIENGYTKQSLVDKSKMAFETFTTFLKNPIENLKVRSMIRLKLQDFNKAVAQDVSLLKGPRAEKKHANSKKPDEPVLRETPLTEEELKEEMEDMGLIDKKTVYQKQTELYTGMQNKTLERGIEIHEKFEKQMNEEKPLKDMGKEVHVYPEQEPASLEGKTVGDPLTSKELEFYRKLGEAHKIKPDNCVITVNLY